MSVLSNKTYFQFFQKLIKKICASMRIKTNFYTFTEYIIMSTMTLDTNVEKLKSLHQISHRLINRNNNFPSHTGSRVVKFNL